MNVGLVIGKLLHSGIETHLKNGMLNPGQVLQEALLDLQKKPDNVFDEDSFGGLPEPVLIQRLTPLLSHITQNLHRDKLLGLEERLEMPLDKYHSLNGFLDIRYRGFDDRMKLADFKFGKQAKSESDIQSFWYQFVGYRMMCEHMFREVPDIAMFTGSISLAAKPKDPFKYLIIPVELNFAALEKELVERMHSLVEYVISGSDKADMRKHYPPTGRTNGACSWCDFIAVCSGIAPEEKFLPKDPANEQKESEIQSGPDQ